MGGCEAAGDGAGVWRAGGDAARGMSSDRPHIHAVRRTCTQPSLRSTSSRKVPASSRAATPPFGAARRFSPPDVETTRSKSRLVEARMERAQIHPETVT